MLPLLIFKLFYVHILFGLAVVSANKCDCGKDAGIMCRYPTTNPGPACVDYKKNYFTDKEKQKLVKKMNEFRNKVALGKETRGSPGPQPSAADMMELTWDDYLGKTAQRYADQCIFEHTPGECRETAKYPIGENLAWGMRMFQESYYLDHVDSWYNEVVDFPSTLVDNYDPNKVTSGKKIGHYAQQLNAKTYHVGCGKTRYGPNDIVVCHYGPTIYGYKPLYTRGPPASKCKKGFKSCYEGLCASGPIKSKPFRILLACVISIALHSIH